MPILHVVIPVFNEPGTLEPCMQRVITAPLPEGWRLAITLVDDSSDADHAPQVDDLVQRVRGQGHDLRFLRHPVNRGKGAALQTGFDAILQPDSGAAEHDLVIIQDADLEYDPRDYAMLMQPIIAGEADAVVGTRWGEHYRYASLKHRVHALGNRALTLLSNLMTGFAVSDMECCYKIMPVRLLRQVRPMLTEQRFGIEPQIVAALARLKARVTQVPVRYDPRGMSAGKKIGWKDGVRALIVITRERCRSSNPRNSTRQK